MTSLTHNQVSSIRVAVITSAKDDSKYQLSLHIAKEVCTALSKCFLNVQLFEHDKGLEHAMLAWRPDVVFPVVHGSESGDLESLLETWRLAYVGSDAVCCRLIQDRSVTYQRISAFLSSESGTPLFDMGFAVPPFVALQRGDGGRWIRRPCRLRGGRTCRGRSRDRIGRGRSGGC